MFYFAFNRQSYKKDLIYASFLEKKVRIASLFLYIITQTTDLQVSG